MEIEEIKNHLVENLGFWPLEDEENTFAKNAPSLSVIYVLVKFEGNKNISIIERVEKTVFDELKHLDNTICSLSLDTSDVAEKLEEVLESYKDWLTS